MDFFAKTFMHQLSADPGCTLEDRPGAMDDRDGWRVRARERERERDRQTDRQTERECVCVFFRESERECLREREREREREGTLFYQHNLMMISSIHISEK